MGTVRYMSPEQVRGQEVDLRTDIYSLGATLYESLVGDTPFDGSTHFEIMTKHLAEAPKRPSALGIEVPRAVEDALMRSLAKKAEDRFSSAREFRKVLEATLRAEDVALTDTQKLGRDILGDLKPPKKPAPPSLTGAATASLADELEPGITGSARVRRSKKLPIAILATLVLAGAGVTAYVVMTDKGGPRYTAVSAVPGVAIQSGKVIDAVLFETDGVLAPEEIADAYRTTLGELEALDTLGAQTKVLHVVTAIPRSALCTPGIVRPSREACVPSDVATTALGKKGARVLFISNDRSQLASTMRRGLAQAVCDFQPTDTDLKKVSAICELTKQFARR
jgi:hypothetical protein